MNTSNKKSNNKINVNFEVFFLVNQDKFSFLIMQFEAYLKMCKVDLFWLLVYGTKNIMLVFTYFYFNIVLH